MEISEKLAILKQCVEQNDCNLFFEEYWNLIKGTIWKILVKKGAANAQDAEELQQIVFQAFLENDRHRLRRYDPEKGASIEGWIKLVSTRIVLNWLRKRSDLMDHFRQNALLELRENHPSEFCIEKQTIQKDDLARIYDAMEQLPPQEKLIFKMSFVYHNTPEEIAEKLHKKIGTVYVCKSRAINRVKTILGVGNNGDGDT
jgi:RNA polymerase sigma factor (sigma-70 family)